MSRLPVKKTYKLFIGGAFPRSESGRTYEAEGQNVARASRKDLRDAVVAARAALPKWAGATAYNRGQVLYRVAEMMEARLDEFAALCTGEDEAARAVDRLVWYAGWADKLAQATGAANPVAGPYFNFTIPEPTGVVGILAPAEPPLAGLVSRLAPALAGGNTVVVVASEPHPLAAVELAEALATADVPGGVVNILTGFQEELAPQLAGHLDVNALDLSGSRRRNRARAARGGQRQTRRARPGGRAEPEGDHGLPRVQDRLASDRAVASRLRSAAVDRRPSIQSGHLRGGRHLRDRGRARRRRRPHGRGAGSRGARRQLRARTACPPRPSSPSSGTRAGIRARRPRREPTRVVLVWEDDDEERVLALRDEALSLGLDCVIEVRTDEELEAALELLDPEIFLLSARDSDDEDGFERALELLPDVPAGKLAIAELHAAGREQVLELERAGVDAVIVGARDVAELVGAAPPQV